MKTRLNIYDMDGTITDSSHRYRTKRNDQGETVIDLDHWIANEHRALDDKELPTIANLRQDIACSETIAVIATARIACHLTKLWLSWANAIPDFLVGRRDRHDSRKGAELKIQGINKILDQHRDIQEITIYEDNRSYLDELTQYYRGRGYSVAPVYVSSQQGY